MRSLLGNLSYTFIVHVNSIVALTSNILLPHWPIDQICLIVIENLSFCHCPHSILGKVFYQFFSFQICMSIVLRDLLVQIKFLLVPEHRTKVTAHLKIWQAHCDILLVLWKLHTKWRAMYKNLMYMLSEWECNKWFYYFPQYWRMLELKHF